MNIRVYTILQTVANAYQLYPVDMLRDKSHYAAESRMVAAYLLRQEPGMTWQRVATILNRADHTTIRHAVEEIEKRQDKERVAQALQAAQQALAQIPQGVNEIQLWLERWPAIRELIPVGYRKDIDQALAPPAGPNTGVVATLPPIRGHCALAIGLYSLMRSV